MAKIWPSKWIDGCGFCVCNDSASGKFEFEADAAKILAYFLAMAGKSPVRTRRTRRTSRPVGNQRPNQQGGSRYQNSTDYDNGRGGSYRAGSRGAVSWGLAVAEFLARHTAGECAVRVVRVVRNWVWHYPAPNPPIAPNPH